MNKKVKSAIRIINFIVVVIVVLLGSLLVGARLFGLKMYMVLSGSMEPEYPTGALIYVKETDPTDLEVGDVITFRLSGDTIATHRIVEIIPDEEELDVLQFRTKGDANEKEDAALVSSSSLIGTPVLTIPYLGRFANYIQSPPGSYAAMAVGAGLILFVFVTDSLIKDKKKTEKQDTDENTAENHCKGDIEDENKK